MSKKNQKLLVPFLPYFISIVIVVSFLFWFFHTAFVGAQFRFHIWQVSQAIDRKIASKTLVNDSKIQIDVQGSADCVYGALDRTYSTSLKWDELRENYKNAFVSLGWEEASNSQPKLLLMKPSNPNRLSTLEAEVYVEKEDAGTIQYRVNYSLGENRCLGG